MPLALPPQSLGRWLSPLHSGVAATNQTFVVGRVFLAQVTVPSPCLVDGLAYIVGSVAAGLVIGGLLGPTALTADTATGAPVVAQSTAAAQGAINTPQVLTFDQPTYIAAGIYYLALEGSDATGTYLRQGANPQLPGITSVYDRAGGFGVLPSPTPTVTSSASGIPGIRLRVAA